MTCPDLSESKILVIGDDYLATNGRSITVDFCEIDNFTPASCEAKLGFDDGEGNTLLITGGVVTDNGDGTWKASVDITNVESSTLEAGDYNWSLEVSESGVEYTVARNRLQNQRIKWVDKQT